MRSVALSTLAAILMGAAPSPETVRFITCPVYRDTDAGRKSGCWLADDRETGQRFDVSAAPSKPDWNHEVLVEGIASPGAPDRCGGVVLDPVRTSVLPGTCTRMMLPGEGYTGNKFSLPKRNIAPLMVARPVPPGPYGARVFHLFFDFDASFVIYQYDDYLLDQAITWIRAAKPRAIVVTGYAATQAQTVSGREIAEDAAVAGERADRMAEALVRLGVDRRIITTRTDLNPQAVDDPDADGLSEASRRRVDIAATF